MRGSLDCHLRHQRYEKAIIAVKNMKNITDIEFFKIKIFMSSY